MRRFSLPASVLAFTLASALLPLPTHAQTKARTRVATMGGNFAGDVREGSGPVAPDDDVVYRGVLARKTHVSACGTKPAPTEDQVAMCSATLVGSAQMNVELEVNEGDRGAWIKMKADPRSPVTKSISGCPEPGAWLKDYYPDGASGLGIETVPSGLLRVGTFTEPGVSLEVIRE